MKEEIDKFERLVLTVHHKTVDIPIETANQVLLDMLTVLSKDHNTYIENVPRVLAILERSHSTGISIQIPLFQKLLDTVLNSLDVYKLDLSFLPRKTADDTSEKLLKILERTLKKNRTDKIRIREFNVSLEDVDDETQLDITKLIFDTISYSGEKFMWDKDAIENSVFLLATLWDLLNRRSKNELFYLSCGQVLDRYSSSGYGQLTRDLAEESIIISYGDNLPHLGFLTAFKSYTNVNSFQAALLYANLCLIKAIDTKNVSNKFIFDIIWQGMKVFRGMGLFPFVTKIYKALPSNLDISDYDRKSLILTYYTTLLKSGEVEQCHSGVSEFLNRNREELILGGINDVKPWLVIIYNLQRLLDPQVFSKSDYPHYIQIFESIVPAENIRPIKEITLGEPELIKPLLKEALIKLALTRNSSDAVRENTTAITMASRLIEKAVQQNDFESLWIASIIKTDVSLSFLEKENEGISPVTTPILNEEEFNRIYGSFNDLTEDLATKSKFDYLWLLISEEKLYSLSLVDNEVSAKSLEAWNQKQFRKLIRSGFFSSFRFDDTIKTKFEVRNVLPNEHIEESKEYTNHLDFARINATNNPKPLVLFQDVQLSGYPHNLFLDEQGEQVHINRPICNALSTEWLLMQRDSKLSKSFSKSIWIPAEGGDFTINQLNGKLEELLIKESIVSTQKIIPENPLNSDINILSSHGDSSIALRQAIYPDNNPRINLNSYVGKGKLLIFLVCHSGSIAPTPFENSISLIAKEFLNSGYSSVIAPFWALHINIVAPWLETLLQTLSQGEPIVIAVYEANKRIFEAYPTIAAWSCMHLYGDPTLKIKGE